MINPMVTLMGGSLLFFIHHRYWCFIRLEVILLEYFLFKHFIQGLNKVAGGMHPARYGCRWYIHTSPFKTLYLTVQGQVVNIFLYDDACQKSRPRHSFFNGSG